jgi:hypothetical protein
MTGEEFAEHLLKRVEAKIAINSESLLSLKQLAAWMHEILGHEAPGVVRPPLTLQQPLPEMQVGQYYPGVGVYTGSGRDATPFDGVGRELMPKKEAK